MTAPIPGMLGELAEALARLPADRQHAAAATLSRMLDQFRRDPDAVRRKVAAALGPNGAADAWQAVNALPDPERATFHAIWAALLAPGPPLAPAAPWAIPIVEATRKRLGTCPRACRHVLAGGPLIWRGGALACAAHPAQGLRCQDCQNAHALTHDDTFERTCDGCGAVVPRIHPGAIPLGLASRVKDQAGRKRVVAAPVFVVGFGACPPCHRKDARP